MGTSKAAVCGTLLLSFCPANFPPQASLLHWFAELTGVFGASRSLAANHDSQTKHTLGAQPSDSLRSKIEAASLAARLSGLSRGDRDVASESGLMLPPRVWSTGEEGRLRLSVLGPCPVLQKPFLEGGAPCCWCRWTWCRVPGEAGSGCPRLDFLFHSCVPGCQDFFVGRFLRGLIISAIHTSMRHACSRGRGDRQTKGPRYLLLRTAQCLGFRTLFVSGGRDHHTLLGASSVGPATQPEPAVIISG